MWGEFSRTRGVHAASEEERSSGIFLMETRPTRELEQFTMGFLAWDSALRDFPGRKERQEASIQSTSPFTGKPGQAFWCLDLRTEKVFNDGKSN